MGFYRKRKGRRGIYPFWLMFGKEPKLVASDLPMLNVGHGPVVEDWRTIELMEVSARPAEKQAQPLPVSGKQSLCERHNLSNTAFLSKKSKSLQPKWIGPYVVMVVKHPEYQLESQGGKATRGRIHARGLRVYVPRDGVALTMKEELGFTVAVVCNQIGKRL